MLLEKNKQSNVSGLYSGLYNSQLKSSDSMLADTMKYISGTNKGQKIISYEFYGKNDMNFEDIIKGINFETVISESKNIKVDKIIKIELMKHDAIGEETFQILIMIMIMIMM